MSLGVGLKMSLGQRLSLSFAISVVSGRLDLDLKRGSAGQRLLWQTLRRDVGRAHAQFRRRRMMKGFRTKRLTPTEFERNLSSRLT